MYEANEKILNHIENFDALSTSAGEQTFKNFGQGAGEKTFEDSSKTGSTDGITEWIKANVGASIAIIITGVLFLAFVASVIFGKKKLNRLAKDALNFSNNDTKPKLKKLLEADVITKTEKANIKKYAKYAQLNNYAQLLDDVEKALKTCIDNASKANEENAPKRKEAANALSFALSNLENEFTRLSVLDRLEKVPLNLDNLKEKAVNLFELKSVSTPAQLSNIDFTSLKTTPAASTSENKANNDESTTTLSSAFEQFKAAFDDIKNTFNEEVATAKAECPGVFDRLLMPDFTKSEEEMRKSLRFQIDLPKRVKQTNVSYDTKEKELLFGENAVNQTKNDELSQADDGGSDLSSSSLSKINLNSL